MRIAVVYNRESKRVINLFGIPNRETYGLKAIRRITDALKAGGHQVISVEGDKDLLDHLEEFMPRVLKGERPGMVFNLSYGIQGQARYTHVPGMLEMAGVPYVGSGPLAHSLALDKVVAKMLFRQHGVPTPEFAVLTDPGFPAPDLPYPLIVKPKNEAVSFGLRIVDSEEKLREASQVIFDEFQQPVLVEQYIEGREINVGLIGNHPPEALPPAELLFGDGPKIYTYDDKTRRSGRVVGVQCPAELDEDAVSRIQQIATQAFSVLGCNDCARVDTRLDEDGNFYVLEVNSLPSLGEHGSYVAAAESVGMDFKALVNRLVDEASTRYFGTPRAADIVVKSGEPSDAVFAFLTGRRDRLEKRVREWAAISSRTSDPVGLGAAVRETERRFQELGLVPREDFTDGNSAWTWETQEGLDKGTLLIVHVDVPLPQEVSGQPFRRDPEVLYGEGVGCSRAPLAMLEYALASLKPKKWLARTPLGILVYSDEGRDTRYSGSTISRAAEKARRVLVLHAGNAGDKVVTQRRGRRKYSLVVEGRPRRPGQAAKKPEVFLWVCSKLQELSGLTSKSKFVSVSPVDLVTSGYPLVLPHRMNVTLMVTYRDVEEANRLEERMRDLLGKDYRWNLALISDRPPSHESKASLALFDRFAKIAEKWDIPLGKESSVWPSAAGLIPDSVATLCGVGPVATDLHTPQEAVSRISLMQRTLLLAEFLTEGVES